MFYSTFLNSSEIPLTRLLPKAFETCHFLFFEIFSVVSKNTLFKIWAHESWLQFFSVFLNFTKMTLVMIPKASHGFEKNSIILFSFSFSFLFIFGLGLITTIFKILGTWKLVPFFCCKIFTNDSHITSQSSRKMSEILKIINLDPICQFSKHWTHEN